jgi:hypothetical protein
MGMVMTFEEKNIWINVAVTSLAFIIYLVVIIGRARNAPIQEIAYVAPMLWTMGGTITASITGHILIACIWREDCGKKDVRDREIGRFGEYVGQSFGVIGTLTALILAMVKAEHFWIANAIFLGCGLSTLLGSATKIIAYRRGFQSC